VCSAHAGHTHGFGKSGGFVLRINIFGEIATFAKPENVVGNAKCDTMSLK
jgi:hypothetical protein